MSIKLRTQCAASLVSIAWAIWPLAALAEMTFTLSTSGTTIDLATWVTSASSGGIAYYGDDTSSYPATSWFHTGTPTPGTVSFTCTPKAGSNGIYCSGTFTVTLTAVGSKIIGFGIGSSSGISLGTLPANGTLPYSFTFTFSNGNTCLYSACSGSFDVGVKTAVTSTDLTAGTKTNLDTYTISITCPSNGTC
ncbi:MAG: hypothetical protein WCO67_25000 [Betaproteobacteria bacterium]